MTSRLVLLDFFRRSHSKVSQTNSPTHRHQPTKPSDSQTKRAALDHLPTSPFTPLKWHAAWPPNKEPISSHRGVAQKGRHARRPRGAIASSLRQGQRHGDVPLPGRQPQRPCEPGDLLSPAADAALRRWSAWSVRSAVGAMGIGPVVSRTRPGGLWLEWGDPCDGFYGEAIGGGLEGCPLHQLFTGCENRHPKGLDVIGSVCPRANGHMEGGRIAPEHTSLHDWSQYADSSRAT